MVRDSVAGKPSVCPLRPDTKVPVVVGRRPLRTQPDHAAQRRSRQTSRQARAQSAGADVSMDGYRRVDRSSACSIADADITFAPDPDLKKIVDGWPKGFISTRAPSLGIVADKNFDDIVTMYLRQHLAETSADMTDTLLPPISASSAPARPASPSPRRCTTGAQLSTATRRAPTSAACGATAMTTACPAPIAACISTPAATISAIPIFRFRPTSPISCRTGNCSNYLEAYADQFGARSRIHFNCEVTVGRKDRRRLAA